jgi:hypothetical protein
MGIQQRRPGTSIPAVGTGYRPPINYNATGQNGFQQMPDFEAPSEGGGGWKENLWNLAKNIPWADILQLGVGAAGAKGSMDAMNRANALRERAMAMAEGDYGEREKFRTRGSEMLMGAKRPDLSSLTAGYTSPYRKLPSVGGGAPTTGATPLPGGIITHGPEMMPPAAPPAAPSIPPEIQRVGEMYRRGGVVMDPASGRPRATDKRGWELLHAMRGRAG